MTHIVRHMDRPGSKPHKGEIAEGVSVLDAPPMVVVGFVGCVETPCGPRALTSLWALEREVQEEVLQDLAQVQAQVVHEV